MKNHRSWQSSVRFSLLIVLCTLAFTACVRNPKPGSVYRDWAARMSEMGIFPVFPPREDIVVGDVYFLPAHPYDTPLIEQVGGAGSAGFHKQNLFADAGNQGLFANLTNYYYKRPVFAPTSTNLDSEVTADESGISPLAGIRPSLNDRETVFGPVPATRLRQVAFPEFSVTTVSEVGLAAMVPIEAIRASIGFSSADVSRISFKIPQAESYGLPSDYLLQNIFAEHVRTAPSTTNSPPRTYLLVSDTANTFMARSAPALARSMFNDSALFVAGRLKGGDRAKLVKSMERTKDHVYLAVISEVYYARSIDINVEFSKARSTSASARPMGIDEINALGKFLKGTPTSGDASVSTSTNPPATEPRASLINVGTNINVLELAAQMRTNNIEMQGSTPGGQVQVVSVGQRNVGLRKKFEQPIAVGVRGLLLKLELHPTTFKDGQGKEHEGFRIITP
jgi:hypothetical protein